MVKVFVVLGVALLAGGGYAVVDGWPYLVLERGFTQVIIGALAATAGLILLALAVVLAELRRLKGMVTGAMAMLTLAGSGRRDEPAHASVPGDDEVPRAAEKADTGLATGLAAGAGAAAIGGALAGLARSGDRPDGAGDETVMARPESGDAPATPPAAADEAAPPPAHAFDHDDWLLPPDPAPAHAVAVPAEADDAEPEAATAAEPDFFEAELLPTPEEPAAPPAAEAEAADTGPAEAEPATADADEAQPDLALEPAAAAADEDKIWWPRLDRFDEGKGVTGDPSASSDDFGALREHLAGASSTKAAPEIEPPRRDFDVAGSWTAPRPWPPVTQPRPPEALGELETPAPAEEAEAEAEQEKSEEDWQTPPAAPEPSAAPAAEAEPAPAGDEPAAAAPEAEAEAEAAGPAPEERPASSEEGIIGAYQVGETHFTMYADGSIHARTPDGDYVFASMDELKTYLASEKNRLEPSSS